MSSAATGHPTVPGKHFLQDDFPAEIAAAAAALAGR
jgi:hypothetical protein